MNGRVHAINRAKGLVAIETELHGYTIIELLSAADIEKGDEISWDTDTKMGAQTYSNLSTRQALEVHVHNHLVSRAYLRQLMA